MENLSFTIDSPLAPFAAAAFTPAAPYTGGTSGCPAPAGADGRGCGQGREPAGRAAPHRLRAPAASTGRQCARGGWLPASRWSNGAWRCRALRLPRHGARRVLSARCLHFSELLIAHPRCRVFKDVALLGVVFAQIEQQGLGVGLELKLPRVTSLAVCS